ncbi:MAG: YceD family protein [Acidobacteriota bacterium]|nr:YceD family protein [Acidobacteriota bacterium]
MRIRLEEIQPNKTVTRELDLERETINGVSGEVVLEDVHATLRLRTDPLGFVVHYDVTGRAVTDCIRCGEPLVLDVAQSDWISLRVSQPDEQHIVLNQTEMNVRFITEPELDLVQFVKEAIELAVPDYPRHEENHSECQAAFSAEPEEVTDTESASPFQALAKYLEE